MPEDSDKLSFQDSSFPSADTSSVLPGLELHGNHDVTEDVDIAPLRDMEGFNEFNADPAAYFTEPESNEQLFNVEYARLFDRFHEYFKNLLEAFFKLHESDIFLERRHRQFSLSKLLMLAAKPFDKVVAEDIVEHVRQRLELWSSKRVSGRTRSGLPDYKFKPNNGLVDELYISISKFSKEDQFGEDSLAFCLELLDIPRAALFRVWRDSPSISMEDRVDFSYIPSEEICGIMEELKLLTSKSQLPKVDLILKKLQRIITAAKKADVRALI